GIVEEAVVAAVVEGHPLIESLAVAVVRANALGGAGHGNELAADLVTFDGDGEASPGAPQLADKYGKLAQGLPAMPVLAGGAWEVDDMAAESRRFDDVPVAVVGHQGGSLRPEVGHQGLHRLQGHQQIAHVLARHPQGDPGGWWRAGGRWR